MSFAAPLGFLVLALIPLVMLLHARNIRWKPLPVSSLHLWDRMLGRPASNPRLSKPLAALSLLLQLIAIAVLALALAQPEVASRGAGRAGDTIVVLDATASMKTREGASTRYDEAKDRALAELSGIRQGSRMLIIEAGKSPRLVLPFTDDRARIRQAIERSAATDESGSLREAILLALSLRNAERGDGIVVITDRAFDSLGDLDLAAPGLTLVPVGTERGNIGITSFQFRRTMVGSVEFELFVSVENFTHRLVAFPLTVTVGSEKIAQVPVVMEPGQSVPVSVPYYGPTEGRARAEIDVSDDLDVDNRAYAVFSPARRVSVLLVGPGNYFLESALGVLPNVAVTKATPDDSAAFRSAASYDVVIYDGGNIPTLASGSFIVLNALPTGLPVRARGSVENPQVAGWDLDHPLTESVSFEGLQIRTAMLLDAEEDFRAVIRSEQTPLALSYESEMLKVLLMGFEIRTSDLPLRPAFPVFLANALAWFAPQWLSVAAEQTQVGAPVVLPVSRGVEALSVVRPDGLRETLPTDDSTVTYSGAHQAGFYRVEQGVVASEFAATLADAAESNTNPRFVMSRNPGETASSPDEPRTAVLKRALWPLFVLIAAGILLCEWIAWAVQRR